MHIVWENNTVTSRNNFFFKFNRKYGKIWKLSIISINSLHNRRAQRFPPGLLEVQSFSFYMYMVWVMSQYSSICLFVLAYGCPIVLARFWGWGRKTRIHSPIAFVPLSKPIFQYMYVYVGLFLDSVLVHCSKYLSFCQYHTFLFTVLYITLVQK